MRIKDICPIHTLYPRPRTLIAERDLLKQQGLAPIPKFQIKPAATQHMHEMYGRTFVHGGTAGVGAMDPLDDQDGHRPLYPFDDQDGHRP